MWNDEILYFDSFCFFHGAAAEMTSVFTRNFYVGSKVADRALSQFIFTNGGREMVFMRWYPSNITRSSQYYEKINIINVLESFSKNWETNLWRKGHPDAGRPCHRLGTPNHKFCGRLQWTYQRCRDPSLWTPCLVKDRNGVWSHLETCCWFGIVWGAVGGKSSWVEKPPVPWLLLHVSLIIIQCYYIDIVISR